MQLNEVMTVKTAAILRKTVKVPFHLQKFEAIFKLEIAIGFKIPYELVRVCCSCTYNLS